MRVNKIWPESGAWPPPERTILIERAALPLLAAKVGDVTLVETPNGQQRALPIAGLAHDLAQLPAQIDGMAYGYISFETLEWLGEPYGFNELNIVTKNRDDKEFAKNVINEVKNKAERIGYTIPLSLTAEPGQIPLGDVLDAILLVMGVLGLLSLFLSAFLIVQHDHRTAGTTETPDRNYESIGARTGQLMGMYLAMVAFYGCRGPYHSRPRGHCRLAGAQSFMATFFNFDLAELEVSSAGHCAPDRGWAAGAHPGLNLSFPGRTGGYGCGSHARGADGQGPLWARVDRPSNSGASLWFARRVLARSWLLSLRNTFRSKGRLVLTLITLTLGGAIFISVFSIRASLLSSLDDLLKTWDFDTMIIFSRPYRIAEIERQALEVPGVVQADTWAQMPVRRVRDDGSESTTIYLFAPPS